MYQIRNVLAGFPCVGVLKDLNGNIAPEHFDKVPTYSNC